MELGEPVGLQGGKQGEYDPNTWNSQNNLSLILKSRYSHCVFISLRKTESAIQYIYIFYNLRVQISMLYVVWCFNFL